MIAHGCAIAHAALRHAATLGWEQPARHHLARRLCALWAKWERKGTR